MEKITKDIEKLTREIEKFESEAKQAGVISRGDLQSYSEIAGRKKIPVFLRLAINSFLRRR